MGFLDDIDEKNEATAATVDDENRWSTPFFKQQPRVVAPDAPDHHQGNNNTFEIWRADPEALAERRKLLQKKPERLSFLQPCPVCRGREFMHLEGSGFQCRTCQPWNVGYPVLATGPDRQASTVKTERLPVDSDTDEPANTPPRGNQPTEKQQTNFTAAWPWISSHKEELRAAGWTMASLIKRSKYRWPIGFGVAWLSVWSRKNLRASIGRHGEIIFTFQSTGRTIKQTAWPPQSTGKANT
ncbi:hypothetical protein JWJ90_17035 [Desulfobulbus rhabdoformis]|uniref:hypothetical protein n=1 Tax=Desulfobulbus rhabdoformis TaxID=34032 RepID=UPI0019657BDA|nr:hypothetical protein [Desulfobulbus rhabdoformis]MBM9615976.1 hypothetical protein [Desulfobulbus rhabdoformis]